MARYKSFIESLEPRFLLTVAALTGASQDLGGTIGVDAADPIRDAVYVYDQSTNHILAIDTDTGTTAGVTTPAAAVAGLAVSPDDTTLYASEPGDSTIETFSLPGMTSLRTISVDTPVNQIAVVHGGQVLGVSGNSVLTFDTTTGRTTISDNYSHDPRIRTDVAGNTLYARNTGDSPGDGAIYVTPYAGTDPDSVALTPGGTDLTDFFYDSASDHAFTGDGNVDGIEVTQISTGSQSVWPLQDGTSVTGLAMLAGGSSVYATTSNGYITQSNMSGVETASYHPAGGASVDSLVITANGKLVSTFSTGVNIIGLSSLNITQTPATPLASSTILTSSATSITAVGTVVLTITVEPMATAGPAPTGTVTLRVTGRAPQTFAVPTNHEVVTTSFTAGTYILSVTYNGDSTYAASTAVPVTIVAAPAVSSPVSSVTQISSVTPNPAVAGSAVTFNGAVSSSTDSGATPTGTVTFYNGDTTLGTASLQSDGSFSFATNALPVGVDAVTASYGGDATYAASVSAATTVTVAAATTAPISAGDSVTTLASVTPNPAAVGSLVVFRGSVASALGLAPVPTGMVTLFNGETSIGNTALLSDGSFTFQTSALPAGTDSLSAQYLGDSVYTASASAPISEVITSGIVPTFGAATLPASVVAGAKFTGSLPLTISNQSTDLKGTFKVKLYADSAALLDGSQTLLQTTAKSFLLKNGKSKPFTLKLKSLPATLADGTYHLFAQVIDPAGASTITMLASTVQVSAPFVALSATLGPIVPGTLVAGKAASLIVTVTNIGNTVAVGPLTVAVGPLSGRATLVTSTHGVSIKPGKLKTVKLRFKYDGSLVAGKYFPEAVVTLGAATTTVVGDVAFTA